VIDIWKETIPRTAELNAPGTFRGRIIKAENIGKSSDDLVAIRKGATDEYCQAY